MTDSTLVSRDKYVRSVFNSVSLHKFLYINANPVTYCDPTGYYTRLADVNVASLVIFNLANTAVASGVVTLHNVMSLFKITLISAAVVAPFVMLFSDELCDILAGLLDGSETSASIGAGVAGNIVDDAMPDVLDDEDVIDST